MNRTGTDGYMQTDIMHTDGYKLTGAYKQTQTNTDRHRRKQIDTYEYIQTYTDTDRQTDRDGYKQTLADTDIQAHRRIQTAADADTPEHRQI